MDEAATTPDSHDNPPSSLPADQQSLIHHSSVQHSSSPRPHGHADASPHTLPITQKLLLFSLYGLILLMVVFSFLAIRDKGQAGFDACIQEKCDNKGQDFCQKPREIMNCCEGASGTTAISGGSYTCVFS